MLDINKILGIDLLPNALKNVLKLPQSYFINIIRI